VKIAVAVARREPAIEANFLGARKVHDDHPVCSIRVRTQHRMRIMVPRGGQPREFVRKTGRQREFRMGSGHRLMLI
jgi:hypothetical protein